jgi:hypothetical protein
MVGYPVGYFLGHFVGYCRYLLVICLKSRRYECETNLTKNIEYIILNIDQDCSTPHV